jgi:hypothetical protein
MERANPRRRRGGGAKRNADGGRNLSTRKPQRFLAEAERSGASAKNARTWKDVGIKRRTQGGVCKPPYASSREGQ